MKFFSSLKDRASSFLDSYKEKSPATYAAAQQVIGVVLITDGFIGIDNPFGGKKRPGIFGSLLVIVVGAVFLFGAGFITNLIGINKMTATTTATVVSVGTSQTSGSTDNSNNSNTNSSCSLTVHYTVDGQEYTKQSSVSSSSNCSLSAGQNVTINYDPANPGTWAYDLKTLGFIIKLFPWFGGLAMISGLITFIIRLFSIIFGWKILRSGRTLAATLPPETNLSTMKNEIRKNFLGSIFNFGSGQPAATSPQVETPKTP